MVIEFVLIRSVLLSLHAPVDLGCSRIFSCLLPILIFSAFVFSSRGEGSGGREGPSPRATESKRRQNGWEMDIISKKLILCAKRFFKNY